MANKQSNPTQNTSIKSDGGGRRDIFPSNNLLIAIIIGVILFTTSAFFGYEGLQSDLHGNIRAIADIIPAIWAIAVALLGISITAIAIIGLEKQSRSRFRRRELISHIIWAMTLIATILLTIALLTSIASALDSPRVAVATIKAFVTGVLILGAAAIYAISGKIFLDDETAAAQELSSLNVQSKRQEELKRMILLFQPSQKKENSNKPGWTNRTGLYLAKYRIILYCASGALINATITSIYAYGVQSPFEWKTPFALIGIYAVLLLAQMPFFTLIIASIEWVSLVSRTKSKMRILWPVLGLSVLWALFYMTIFIGSDDARKTPGLAISLSITLALTCIAPSLMSYLRGGKSSLRYAVHKNALESVTKTISAINDRKRYIQSALENDKFATTKHTHDA